MTEQSDASREPFSEAEWKIRCDLAAAYRLVALFGWDDLVFTHISARLPGPDHHFLINPYGMLFEEITASSLVKVGLDGQKIGEIDALVNPAGFTIHSAVHDARADAGCVMHLHTVDGVAVSCQKDGLIPINQTAMLLNGQLSYHAYEGVALNHDERPRLVADLGSNNLMILSNHGTLAVGSTVAAAFLHMYFLERACSIQIAAQASDTLITPAAEVQEVVRKQAGNMEAGANLLVWPALLRRLNRENPGYAV